MKTLTTIWTLSILIAQVLVCFSQEDEPVNAIEYWASKQIWLNKDSHQQYISKQPGEKPTYPFEAVVLDSKTISMAISGSEYVYIMAKITPGIDVYQLPFQEWDAPVYHNKKYFLKLEPDSLILSIHDSHGHIDTIVFMKPDPRLRQKSLDVVMVSYLLSGDYAITHSNRALKKDIVTFSLDSRVSGLDSLSRWEFGHLLGIKKPYRKGLGGVLQFTGLVNKNYYAIYTGTGWEFYTYERDKMSVYHLSEEPDIILQDLRI